MPVLSKPSSAPRTALSYITIGALIIIWTAVFYWWRKDHPPANGGNGFVYLCGGFLVTGITLLAIGLAVGQIGRAARHAELPPPEVTATEARVEQMAAARAPLIAPINPAAAAVAPNGQAVVSSPGLAGVPPAAAVPPSAAAPGVAEIPPSTQAR